MKSHLKFLVIDDEIDITEVLILYVLKYFDDSEIKSVTNPLEAIEMVEGGYFPDIIILDLNMPQMKGPLVVKRLLALNPKLNIIIYSGAIGQFELINNVELGIKGILEKPSAPEELRDEVNRILSEDNAQKDNFVSYNLALAQSLRVWHTDLYVIIGKNKYVKLFKNGDEVNHEKIAKMLELSHVRYVVPTSLASEVTVYNYIPIDILTLRTTQHSPCDIFLKNKGEYKKIISKGSAIINDYLKLLQKKDFKHLHIEEQFEKYFKIIPENILILRINDAELERSERVKALLTYADQRLDDLYAEPTEKNILNVDYLSEQISKYLDDDKGALLNILNYKSDYDAKSHVINIATLATSIHQRFEPMLKDPNAEKRNLAFAQKLSFTPLIKKNIVLAGLLHDLKSTLKSPADQPAYNARQEAIKLLSSIKSIPPMVVEMIEHHEEKFDGSGPRKMYKANINIYSQILIVTVQYQTSLSKGKTPQEVLVEMFREKEKYNEVILNALKSLVVL